MSRVGLITGATRNLGLALAVQLAARLQRADVVYLTGRDPQRVRGSVARIAAAHAQVRGETLDVADAAAVQSLAKQIATRHGGIDFVLSNHYSRVAPEDDPAAVIDHYVAANNLGTTQVLRCFAPLLRDGGRLLVIASRAGTLSTLAPILHARFEQPTSLDAVDEAVIAWRDAVREGRAAGEAWPAWINIPSKIGQVAAVRALARERRESDLRRGILIAAISPGLIDTGASRPYFADMSAAQTPEQAAAPIIDLVLQPQVDPRHYGALVHLGRNRGTLGSNAGFGDIIPWKPVSN